MLAPSLFSAEGLHQGPNDSVPLIMSDNGSRGARILSSPMDSDTTAEQDGSLGPLVNGTGRKKALLIACTYNGVNDPDPTMPGLPNSGRDPFNVEKLLREHGYKREDITILLDVGENQETYPTRNNIIKHMHQLVRDAQPGDVLFFQFSGHGSQTEAIEDIFEVDGLDECIHPCDYLQLRNKGQEDFIRDDLLRKILIDPLPEGCKLTALIDCCSSGTMLDLPIVDSDTEALSRSVELLATDPPSLEVPAARTIQKGPIRSQTLPTHTYLYSRSLRPVHVLPLMRPLGTEDLNVADAGVSPTPQDTRVIRGIVICFASCEDSARTYETKKGGALIQAFCATMTKAKKDNQVLTLRSLKTSLCKYMGELHARCVDKLKAEDEPFVPPPAPVPQFSFSRKLDLESAFSLS